MNGLIGLAGVLALLLLAGAVIGVLDRRHFSWRWLVVAALLVALNDALLTRVYGSLPDFVGGRWNWQGKLLALYQAFRGRKRLLGVDWGWGAILSCALFGLAHAFGYSGGGFSFDAITMALTAVPSLIAVWLRLRTGSLLLPVVLHNFGNAITMLL